jgi:hypothetical protein
MDEFRVALLVTRIIAALLIILGGSWLLVWGLTALNDWVFTGSLARSSFRLTLATYAGVDATAGVIMGRFSHQIARFATKE